MEKKKKKKKKMRGSFSCFSLRPGGSSLPDLPKLQNPICLNSFKSSTQRVGLFRDLRTLLTKFRVSSGCEAVFCDKKWKGCVTVTGAVPHDSPAPRAVRCFGQAAESGFGASRGSLQSTSGFNSK